MRGIQIVFSNDWEALYCDGILLEEGHSLNVRDILEKLDYKVETFSATEKLEDLLLTVGYSPQHFDDYNKVEDFE